MVSSSDTASVPAPLLILTLKVKDPGVPSGVSASPASAGVKFQGTTTAVVPTNSSPSAFTNACAFVITVSGSAASTCVAV